jgi:hypothetical protein
MIAQRETDDTGYARLSADQFTIVLCRSTSRLEEQRRCKLEHAEVYESALDALMEPHVGASAVVASTVIVTGGRTV